VTNRRRSDLEAAPTVIDLEEAPRESPVAESRDREHNRESQGQELQSAGQPGDLLEVGHGSVERTGVSTPDDAAQPDRPQDQDPRVLGPRRYLTEDHFRQTDFAPWMKLLERLKLRRADGKRAAS
jgi:hypothetical protein